MTRHFYILLIVMLGFFLTPALSYACGTMAEKTEKSCCKKEASPSDTKACCEKSHSQKDNTDDGCNGKCKNSLCHCPSINISIVLPIISEIAYKSHFVEKQNFFDTEAYISSGFHSIWLPPKIG